MSPFGLRSSGPTLGRIVAVNDPRLDTVLFSTPLISASVETRKFIHVFVNLPAVLLLPKGRSHCEFLISPRNFQYSVYPLLGTLPVLGTEALHCNKYQVLSYSVNWKKPGIPHRSPAVKILRGSML